MTRSRSITYLALIRLWFSPPPNLRTELAQLLFIRAPQYNLCRVGHSRLNPLRNVDPYRMCPIHLQEYPLRAKARERRRVVVQFSFEAYSDYAYGDGEALGKTCDCVGDQGAREAPGGALLLDGGV